MTRDLFAGAFASIVLTLTSGSVATAAERLTSHMPLGSQMIAPSGFRAYCEASASNCVAFSAQQTPRMLVDGGATTSSRSPWQAAFTQARAEREYPTGSIGVSRDTTARTNWRLERSIQPAIHAPAALLAAPPVTPVHGPELQIPTPTVATQVALDRDMRRTLQQVNESVNARIHPARDEDFDDGSDIWGARLGSDGDLYGDCEDYVLAKRAALLARGVPAAALSIAVARNGPGETHAVLVVTTDRGDYVLDNLSFWVRPWNETSYDWVMRQNHGAANDWRAIVSVAKVDRTSVRNPRNRRT